MAGGKFNGSKVRPGLYVNFEQAALSRIQSGDRGIVALPILAPFGEKGKIKAITTEADAIAAFGVGIAQIADLREAKKNARTVLAFRLTEGVKASGVVATVLTVTAKFGGTLGNKMTVKVALNPLDGAKKDVSTLVDGVVRDVQTVATIGELKANAYVTFAGTPATAPADGSMLLIGGTDVAPVAGDYSAFLAAAELELFDVIAVPTEDSAIKASVEGFVKRLRDDEGKKIVGVLANHAGNYEGLINVANGVILEDGTALVAKDVVAYVAGASAGAEMNQSLTYAPYAGAMDANPRMTNAQVTAALQAGKLVFNFDGDAVRIEQDLNSLTQYSNRAFTKNRVVRVLDAINNDLTRSFNKSYLGQINNDADGQAQLKTAIDLYMLQLQANRAIKNYDPETDSYIDPVKSVGEEVYVEVAVQPVDSVEKIYLTVRVQ